MDPEMVRQQQEAAREAAAELVAEQQVKTDINDTVVTVVARKASPQRHRLVRSRWWSSLLKS